MRVLMCFPEHFDVTYEINAWMHVSTKPDPALAKRQWEALNRILREDLALTVELVEPQREWPDMVFTANAGLIWNDNVIPSRFRFPERQGEVPHFNRWFADHGYSVHPLPDSTIGCFEGEGDILLYGETFLAGYRMRSDISVYPAVSEMTGKQVLPLELVDTRWYHIDTCLFPLSEDLLAYFPAAFDEYARIVIEGLPGEKIRITEADALRFGGNAVVAGNKVAMNSGCDDLAEQLENHGFSVYPTDLSEFLKSGGAAKCLTLLLEH